MLRRRARRPCVLFAGALAAAVLAPTSPAAAVDLGERTLAPGMKGADVKQLQQWLGRLGLPTPRTGRYDTRTEAAVRRYERHEDIDEDALVTREQAREMRRDARPRRREVTYASRTLMRGRSGTDVRALQRYLLDLDIKVSVDGEFGPATQRAVRRLERKVKAKVDGKVTRTQARQLRAVVPAPQTFGVATPVVSPTPTAAATGARVFPIQGAWNYGGEGAGFGERGGAHKGIDVFAKCGVPMVAAESGKVVFKANESRAGHYIVIRGRESGEDHVYMHLQSASPLGKADEVEAGQRIGAVGDTGNATACHLHFEIWTAPGWFSGGAPRDPMPDFRAWAAASGTKPSR